ncbi:MAG: D-alanine--D-alanine ligase [Solirubrobacteraceae bacterium]|nr:D-alanine--D-alanine ligase [Solirubrobacteraceae bacterium]
MMRVAVLSGGRSSEHEISLVSGAAVAEGLREAGHEVLEVTLDREGGWSFEGSALKMQAGAGLLGADAVFPVLHGPYGEDGTVQGLLEILDVAYVGSGVPASAICVDKIRFKEAVAAAGLPQVDWVGLVEDEPADRREEALSRVAALGYPVFVKPARLGSSVGIVRVASAEELAPALAVAFGHDPRVIVEAASGGLEVEVGILGPTRAPEASVPGEIVVKGSESPGGWYDYAAKYKQGGMELQVPARISDAARDRLREEACSAFTQIGCSGLSRVDFFVEGDDVLINEINTIPGFTPTSVYAALWEASGLPYSELCDRLVGIAVADQEERRRHSF